MNWVNLTGSTSHNWEVQPQGVAQGTAGAIATGTSDPSGVTASNLSSATVYDFYVQMDCGATNSSWTGPITFTTLCAVEIPDYNEDFTGLPLNVGHKKEVHYLHQTQH